MVPPLRDARGAWFAPTIVGVANSAPGAAEQHPQHHKQGGGPHPKRSRGHDAAVCCLLRFLACGAANVGLRVDRETLRFELPEH